MTEEMIETEGYVAIAVNIKYGNIKNEKIKTRPDIAYVEIPEGKLKCKDEEKRNDLIESYVYDYITKKYGAEVNYCQVYLPIDR